MSEHLFASRRVLHTEARSVSIVDHFSNLTDPRIDRKKEHKLIDIVVIGICAVICADDWVAIESFGKAKYKWLDTFLELPNGIPSHDTFGRVFSLINPFEFRNCFVNWIQSVFKVSNSQVIPNEI